MFTSVPTSTLEKFTTFGDLLRFLRRRMGITQTELATAVGYSTAQISRLEQNLRLPDIPTIEARFGPALGLEEEPKAVARLLALAANVRREDVPAPGLCPYRGLNYFDEADADFFVGREALTTKLVERVLSVTSNGQPNDKRFLAIVGASGSGKSSLVRAGLVPRLRWNKASADWPIHVLTPTAHPLDSLAASLTRESQSPTATAALIDDWARNPHSLQNVVKDNLGSKIGARLLLVIDQFEELFALCRSEEERSAFIDNLLTVASEAGGPTIVVITLRADFYAYCAGYVQLREALAQYQEYIGAMNAGELRRVIEEPAHRGRWEFEPGLVDLLLHDVGHEPGALPLLSHALFETWQRRRGRTLTLSGYASSGGVRGAIAETAETVFTDQFTHEQQAIARRIFLRLTELSDEPSTADTRRRATFNELILKPDEAATTQEVLSALADARLITTSEDSAEVAHEALIREWPTLRGWLEDNRDGLRLHRHLTEAAQEWATLDREPAALLRGARLIQVREWAESHGDELNTLEHEFLQASIEFSEHEAREREAQRQRELLAAQQLAEAEKRRAEEQTRSANRLRLRNRVIAAAGAIALLLAVLAGMFGTQANQNADLAQHDAATAQAASNESATAEANALAQRDEARARALAAAAINNMSTDPERSILLALQAVTTTYTSDNKLVVSEAENALHQAVSASHIRLTLSGNGHEMAGAAFSPDGTRLATANWDGTAKVWDAATGKPLLTLTGHTGPVNGITFSPDGSRLATVSSDGTIKVWDALMGKLLLTLTDRAPFDNVDISPNGAIVFSPDGTRLATANRDKTAKVWDAVTGSPVLTLTGHSDSVVSIAFSLDGKRLATASWDKTARVWDAITGAAVLTLTGHIAQVTGVAFSPDGTRLATASDDRTAKVWDATNGKELLTLTGHTDGVWGIAFSPDGTHLATVSWDRTAMVWDATNGLPLFTLRGHADRVFGIAYSPDGTRLATASRDGTVKVWETIGQELLTLTRHTAPLASVAFSPDGMRLATTGDDKTAKVWNAATGQLLLTLSHRDRVHHLAFSPDSTRLATASEDGTAKIWDVNTGKELLTLTGHSAAVLSIVFSPDGTRLATASWDSTARMWDASTGKPLLTLPDTGPVFDVAFSPDGTRLATAGNDQTAKVWDTTTGKLLFTLHGFTQYVTSVAFSPDGTRLAVSSADQTAKVWNASTGQLLVTLIGHTNGVQSIVFSPDGTRLATASWDWTAKLWNATTGQELLTLTSHTNGVNGISFSPDGTHLATASADDTARVYVLPIEQLMALARTRLTRTWTQDECKEYLQADTCPPTP